MSYDVYLWKNKHGDFDHVAKEIHDDKDEVRVHDGKPPVAKIPRPTCPKCYSRSWVHNLERGINVCNWCGFSLTEEKLRGLPNLW